MNCKKCGAQIPKSFFKRVCDKCIKENKEKFDDIKNELISEHKSFKLSDPNKTLND
jgi:NMD protein affecting ribosome stability and mRNA decay